MAGTNKLRGIAAAVTLVIHMVPLALIGLPLSERQHGGGKPVTHSMVTTMSLIGEQAPPEIPQSSGNEPTEVENPATGSNYSTAEDLASPVDEWILPLDELSAYARVRIVIRVWVLSTGEIEQVELLSLEPEGISLFERKNIEDWIKRTPMTPARVAGRAVDSQRTIELIFER